MSTPVIVVVASHPDDEVLGCGGTIALHVERGDEVHVIFVADGVSSRGNTTGISKRQVAALEASKILGYLEPTFLQLLDNQLDTLPLLGIVQKLEMHFRRIRPSIVYTHHGSDLNIDHRLVHTAVLTACRPTPDQSVHTIYSYEVVSSTEWSSPEQGFAFRPVRYVDVSSCVEKKFRALQCYRDEVRMFPHPRSIEAVEALGRLRGSQVGVEFAEAFGLIRQIEKR